MSLPGAQPEEDEIQPHLDALAVPASSSADR
jgi:hypothetical protein